MGRPKITRAGWVVRALDLHDHKYDYSQVEYTGAHDDVTIVCPIHGPWTMKATAHINAKIGCTQCLYMDKFIQKARRVHGARYDYSKLTWSNDPTKTYTIVCREHGPFEMTPRRHLAGMHCHACRSPKPIRSLGFGDYTVVNTYVPEDITTKWIFTLGKKRD